MTGLGKAKADPRWEQLSADVPTLAKMITKRVDASSEIRNISYIEAAAVSKDTTYQRTPSRDQRAGRYASYPMNTVRNVELEGPVNHFSVKSLQTAKIVNYGSFRTQTARDAPLITFEDSEVGNSCTGLAQGIDHRIKGLNMSTQREAESPNSQLTKENVRTLELEVNTSSRGSAMTPNRNMSSAKGEDSYIPSVSDNVFIASTANMKSLYMSPPNICRQLGSPPLTGDILRARVAYDLQNLDTRRTTFSGENVVRQVQYDSYHPTLASTISDKLSIAAGRRLSSVDFYLRSMNPPTPSPAHSIRRDTLNENEKELADILDVMSPRATQTRSQLYERTKRVLRIISRSCSAINHGGPLR